MTTRRNFLAFTAGAPLIAFGLAGAVGAENVVCYNPDALPASQKSMRKALGFQQISPASAKVCGGCAFFTAGGQGCGKCKLLSGGPVTAASYCRSWAEKA